MKTLLVSQAYWRSPRKQNINPRKLSERPDILRTPEERVHEPKVHVD